MFQASRPKRPRRLSLVARPPSVKPPRDPPLRIARTGRAGAKCRGGARRTSVPVSTYAIGDIQGCFDAFSRLLASIAFRPDRDRLWLAGDLVNRGPDSLAVLRWCLQHADSVVAVLGNHDLHALARAAGAAGPKRRDSLDELLHAPDRDALLDWLRHRPLLYREGRYAMVHAGLLPAWTVDEAEAIAQAYSAELNGARMPLALRALRDQDIHVPELRKLAQEAGLLTRIRTCTVDGEPCTEFAGPPEEAPPGCIPWFRVPGRKSAEECLVFGHWAALGLLLDDNLIALDTGCVWGNALTAVRLEDRAVFQVPAAPQPANLR